jgi:hypothetical protein
MKIPYTLGFYSVKITSIVILTVLYVIAGTIVSITLDSLLPEDHPTTTDTMQLLSMIFGTFIAISLIYYFLRVQLKHVPSIFDGMFGFNHLLVREAYGGIVFAYIMYCYQTRLRAHMIELGNRITKSFESIRIKLRDSIQSFLL